MSKLFYDSLPDDMVMAYRVVRLLIEKIGVKGVYDFIEKIVEDMAINIYTEENVKKTVKEIERAHEEYIYSIKIDDSVREDDPLLNYVLTHKIPAGHKRNMVVLKNLAPILVSLKKDNDVVLKRKIIQNMPGKNVAELDGWIRKARKGKLRLNKLEVNKWWNEYGVV